jgi:hypothetical protein
MTETKHGQARVLVGTKLPNGAVILAAKTTPDAEVYLAWTGPGSPTPYVTWAAYNGPASTVSGHYFDSIVEAAKDYVARWN